MRASCSVFYRPASDWGGFTFKKDESKPVTCPLPKFSLDLPVPREPATLKARTSATAEFTNTAAFRPRFFSNLFDLVDSTIEPMILADDDES